MHNTFTVSFENNKFVSRSHNFPDIYGEGATDNESLEDMNRKIIYFKDNNPKQFVKNIRDRVAGGLECNCGYQLTDTVLAARVK